MVSSMMGKLRLLSVFKETLSLLYNLKGIVKGEEESELTEFPKVWTPTPIPASFLQTNQPG